MTDEAHDGVLDAYSRAVTGVAERLTPAVASLRVGSGRRRGEGSAVVLTADGFLLTAAHVVSAGDRGRALFADGRDPGFRVVGRDPLSDLAVLRTDEGELAAAELGDAASLRVGQLVVAIGNPRGLGGSVSAGVVSALGRSLPVRAGAAARVIDSVVQTDAALNPGSSGGALADASARVVGINTAVAGVGLGLAVPVNDTTRRLIGEMMSTGRVRRAFLGIVGGPRPLPPRARAELAQESAIEVTEVSPDSPAARAGLRPEDLIVAIGDRPIRAMDELQAIMVGDVVGTEIAVSVLRAGVLVSLSLVPDELAVPVAS